MRTAKGWHVEITNPNTGHVFEPPVVGRPSRIPKANQLPILQVPVPRNTKWQNSDFEEAKAEAWFNGKKQPVEELAKVEMTPGETILKLRGGQELLDKIEVQYSTKKIHLAAEDIIKNKTSYTANVDVPASDTDKNVQKQSADTSSEFDSVTPNFAADTPLSQGSSVSLQQTCWVFEPEDENSGLDQYANTAYSGEEGEALSAENASGDEVVFSFTTNHEIPVSDFHVNFRRDVREENDSNSSQYPGYQILLDEGNTGSYTKIHEEPNDWGPIQASLQWTTPVTSATDGFSGNISAGTHLLKIKQDQAGDSNKHDAYIIDVVAVTDARYSYNFDNDNGNAYSFDSTDLNNTSEGFLDGPELYPPSEQVAFSNVTTTKAVTGGKVESSWNDTSGNQKIEISNDNGGSYPLSATNTDTHEADFSSIGTDIRWRATLGRWGSRTGTTPKQGYKGQQIDSYTLYADESNIPIVDNYSREQSALEILRELARYGDMLFEYQDDGTKTIEWTEPGQRTSSKSPSVAQYEVTKDATFYEKGVVYGASQKELRESFTSDHGNYVDLNQADLITGTEVVYNQSNDTVFSRSDDYEMDYDGGRIKTLSGGSMSDSTSYTIDYDYKLRGTYTKSGVNNPNRTIVEDFPSITTQQTVDQTARILVQRLDTPRYEARVIIPNEEAGWSVIDEIDITQVPTQGNNLQIEQIENTPQQTVILLGSREKASDVVSNIQNRLSAVQGRV